MRRGGFKCGGRGHKLCMSSCERVRVQSCVPPGLARGEGCAQVGSVWIGGWELGAAACVGQCGRRGRRGRRHKYECATLLA